MRRLVKAVNAWVRIAFGNVYLFKLHYKLFTIWIYKGQHLQLVRVFVKLLKQICARNKDSENDKNL